MQYIIIFQFTIIISLFWLGCYFDINQSFLLSKGRKFWVFVISNIFTIIFGFLSIVILVAFFYEENCVFDDFFSFIIAFLSCIFFIPLTIYYCFLFTDFIKYEYILEVLVLILFDFMIMEIDHCISKSLDIAFIVFLQLIDNAIILLIYYFCLIKKKE